MARSQSSSSSHLSRDSARLVALSLALHSSGSKLEDRYWEKEMCTALTKLMKSGNDPAIDAALDHMSTLHPGGYEVLIEQAETVSESYVITHEGKNYDVLLLVAPLVAWTRYSIPATTIPTASLKILGDQLKKHILSKHAKIALMPHLASLDQMPRTFCETWNWMQRLGEIAVGKSKDTPLLNAEPESFNMLADTRYLVAAVLVPEGETIFRWQEEPGELGEARKLCLANWTSHTQDTFNKLLTGCGFEMIVPDAYYVSNREADRRVRPLSVKAAVAWLCGALNIEATQLRAVVAGCGEERIEEYRIGFTQKNQAEVIYGCLWPLYGPEDAEDESERDAPIDTIDEIAALLKECGVTDIRRLPGILPPESCEDCTAPYFPNASGEMVHAELPADAETAPTHFH